MQDFSKAAVRLEISCRFMHRIEISSTPLPNLSTRLAGRPIWNR